MEIYKQTDERWASIPLGDSPYSVGSDGCTTTAVAQALTLAGYTVTPGDLATALNATGGYTDQNHPQGPGLLIWNKVATTYPQFHFQQSNDYQFLAGVIGHSSHWVLKYLGLTYDPLNGSNTIDPWVRGLTQIWSAAIDPAPHTIKRATVVLPAGLYIRTSPYKLADNHSLVNGLPDIILNGQPCDWDYPVQGESIEGNATWLHKPDGLFVWSGGTNYIPNIQS